MPMRFRRRRQLQHRRALSLAETGHKYDLPVWELERIMVHVRLMRINLPETGDPLLDPAHWQEAERRLAQNVLLECQFGTGHEANRDVAVVN
jgi:hypothetical protein